MNDFRDRAALAALEYPAARGPQMSDEDDDTITCWQCEAPCDDWLCAKCTAERDAHPVWQAIQRVERGEVTVTRQGDRNPGHFANYYLRTSDGWVFEIFPDGTPFDDWDYIYSATSPDGTKYEPASTAWEEPPHPIPHTVWGYAPWEHRAKWSLAKRWW